MHGNTSRYPLLPQNLIFGYFIILGYFGAVKPPKIENLWTKSRVLQPAKSFFMLGTWNFAWELIFHRCSLHFWGIFESEHSMWGFEAVKDPKNAIFQAKITKITKIAITQPFLKLETSDFAQKYIYPSYTSPYIRFWPQKYLTSTFGWWKVPFLDIFGDEMAPKSWFFSKNHKNRFKGVIFYARNLKFCMRAYFS